MTPAAILITAGAVGAAAFATGLTGYGFGLVAMGILPYVMSVAEANALVVPLAFVLTIVALIPLRRELTVRLLWPVALGALAGVPIGVVYLIRLDEGVLRLSLGVIIFIALAGSIFGGIRERRRAAMAGGGGSDAAERSAVPRSGRGRIAARRIGAVGVGLVSGAFGGAFSVSGPPVVLYLSEILPGKRRLKAHLLAYFNFVISIRLILLSASGVITAEVLKTAVWMLPALGIGVFAGTILHNRLPTQIVRVIIQGLLAISALLLIVAA